jgi:hypothetical protein
LIAVSDDERTRPDAEEDEEDEEDEEEAASSGCRNA